MPRSSESFSQSVVEKLIKTLRSKSYGVTPVNVSGNENDWNIEKICVLKQGRDLCDINCQTGTISYMNSYDQDTVNDILKIIKIVRWEDEVYRKAPNIENEELKKYRLLSQFNDVILAACEIFTIDHNNQKVSQFDYVTWKKDEAIDGVHNVNCFGENYAAAKEDFAKRSGLINRDKLFSETELLTIYSGFVKIQDIEELSVDQEQIIDSIKNKISNVLSDINENMYQATRIDNALEFMEQKLMQCDNQLVQLRQDLETAREEYEKPWRFEEEYKAKLARQAELNMELDINKQDEVLADESSVENEKEKSESEVSSQYSSDDCEEDEELEM
jgi:hypothetical protein